MVVRRSRTVAAPVDDVWRIVRDPYHLPRWWPRTQRVEGVSDGGWTSVMLTDKGRAVRLDFRVEASRGGKRRRWAQEVEGTAFERLLRSVAYETALAPAASVARDRDAIMRQPRGGARFGGIMLRRAGRRQL